jgi:serine/threonine protein kinase
MDWFIWCRIAVLLGLFCSHAANIGVTYPHTEIIELRFHIFSLFLVIMALSVQCTGYFLDISMALCDSGVFGVTVGALIAVNHWWNRSHSSGGTDITVFIPIDCLLIIGLFAFDLMIVLERKAVYHDVIEENENNTNTNANTAITNINANLNVNRLFSRGFAHQHIRTDDDVETGQTVQEHSGTSMSSNSSIVNGNSVIADQMEILAPVIRSDNIAKYDFVATEASMRADGYKVNLSKLPPLVEVDTRSQVVTNCVWSDFKNITHLIDSSSCHIYTATWTGRYNEKPVILKLIKLERMSSALSMSEFEAEACILSRVRHPHIISLLGCGNNPRPFLVLELLEGGTLGHTLGVKTEQTTDIGKCPPRQFTYIESLTIALALANALHYLHEQWNDSIHVIHRDLKPDNIGWTETGIIKIFDFGLCAVVKSPQQPLHGQRRTELTEAYKLTGNTGTLRYMAPEVALGKSYNSSVDVYSFSIIIWQIARGKVPFENLGRKAFITKVVREGLRPPLDPSWPDNFKAMLLLCWHEERIKRPTFSVIIMELEKLLQEARESQLNRQHISSHKMMVIMGKLRLLARILRMLRPVAVFISLLLIILGIALVGKPAYYVDGLLIVATASSLLYLICLSYWKTIVREYISKRRTFGDSAATAVATDPNNSSNANTTSNAQSAYAYTNVRKNSFGSVTTTGSNNSASGTVVGTGGIQMSPMVPERESFNPIAQSNTI